MLKRTAFVLFVLALAFALPAAGQDEKYPISGQIGLVGYIQSPQMRVNGPGPEPKHIVARSSVQLWAPADFFPQDFLYDTPEPLAGPDHELLYGTVIFYVNCNFDPEQKGPCWGTFRWELSGTSWWEGSWASPLMDMSTYESLITMVGHGVGGPIDGMQLKVDGYSAPGDYFITFKARVK